MDRVWAEYRYTTEFFEDVRAGCAGLKLRRAKGDVVEHVATVTYWDAMGQYVLEAQQTELPVNLVEDLIAETKAKVGV